jgi:hypothetical protein
VSEEGRGENEVVQPVNPAANAAANAPANPAANLQQTLRPKLLAMPLTTQPMLQTTRETLLQTQDTMQELSLLQSTPTVLKESNVIA